MATAAVTASPIDREHRFFLINAIIMSLVLIAGFGMSIVMGRSSFGAPWFVHAHALIFFGWATLYLLQNALVATGSVALHRRLGWLAVGWLPAMVVAGTGITVISARAERIPFFFQPAYFLVMDPLGVWTFAGLAAAGIAMRRQTLWHRRLLFCGMAILMGPGFGRFLPVPLFMPFVGPVLMGCILLFPLAGIVHDRRTYGRIHPAWFWGIAAIVAMEVSAEAISHSPIGPAIYRAVTAGSPGAALPPMDFPPPPWARHKTG